MPRVAKPKYKAKKGSMLTDTDAQKVGIRLEKIAEKNSGEIKPELVVEDAKARNSPLHKYFEWEDTAAAEKYRKHQARLLMGAVVEVKVSNGRKREQRSFYNVVNTEGERVYVNVQTVRQTPDYIDQLMQDAERNLERLQETLLMLRHEYKGRKKR